MSKMIGLARPLRIEWLNKTVDLFLSGLTIGEIKAELNSYLAFEIDSPTTLRKTRESLINLWVSESECLGGNKEFALSIYPGYSSNKLPIHWCMLVARYPIFADMCVLISKVSSIEGSFTTAWMREKLYESWGERTSLEVSVKNILRTMVDFGTLEKVKTGVYRICEQTIRDDRVVRLMVLTLLGLGKKAYYEIAELSRASVFFPFEYNVTLEWLHNVKGIHIGNFGGKVVVSAEELVRG